MNENHTAGSATGIDLSTNWKNLQRAAQAYGPSMTFDEFIGKHPWAWPMWNEAYRSTPLARATPQHSVTEQATAWLRAVEPGEIEDWPWPFTFVDPSANEAILGLLNAFPVYRAQPLASTAATQPERASNDTPELRELCLALRCAEFDSPYWHQVMGDMQEYINNRAALAIPASTATPTREQLEAALHAYCDDTIRLHAALGFGEDEVIDVDKMIERIGAIPASTAASEQPDDFAHIDRLSKTTTRPYDPIYQTWDARSGKWSNVTKAHFNNAPKNARRIVKTPASSEHAEGNVTDYGSPVDNSAASEQQPTKAEFGEYARQCAKSGTVPVPFSQFAASEQQAGADERALYEAYSAQQPKPTLSWDELSDYAKNYWRGRALTHRATTATDALRNIRDVAYFDSTVSGSVYYGKAENALAEIECRDAISKSEGATTAAVIEVQPGHAFIAPPGYEVRHVVATTAADQQGDILPRWIDDLKGKDPTIDGLIEYIIAQQGAAQAQAGDARDAARYRFVKSMSKETLLVWRGMYGCADEAVDAAMAAPATGSKA